MKKPMKETVEKWNVPQIPIKASYVDGVSSPVICLNSKNEWKFIFETNIEGIPLPTASSQDFSPSVLDNKIQHDVIVPGELLMQGFNILNNTEYYYQRKITIPNDYANNRILIRFSGVYTNTRIWIDGKYIRTHIGGFTTWDCDITDFVKAGETYTLTVGVADTEGDNKGTWNMDGGCLSDPSSGSAYAHHNIGGILRDVTLMALPFDYIIRVYTDTVFDNDYKNAELKMEVEIGLRSENAFLTSELTDKNGNKIASDKTEFTKQGGEIQKITIPVDAPDKWDAEHPNLYNLTFTLESNGNVRQKSELKIGFREISYGGQRGTDSGKLYVNGKEVKLRGTCRHDVSYDLGRSTTKEQDRFEIEFFKKHNINFIRTSHYPASDYILDACDEFGIYVEQETAVCFKGTWRGNHCPPEYFVDQFIEMIEKDRNRASVLIWSLANECNYNDPNQTASDVLSAAFGNEFKYVKETDISRPVIFSYPYFYIGDEKPYDIYSAHYTNWENELGYVGNEADSQKLPVLHDEYAHIACYNLNELKRDTNVRNFWGESIYRYWENMFETDSALGGALWGGIDEVFFIPENTDGRHIKYRPTDVVGYGEWGCMLDVFMREKPEAYLTKKAYSPVRVDIKNAEFKDGNLIIPVKNWFDHTDFDELTLKYKTYDGIEKEITPNSLAPHEKGILTVENISPDTDINLKFFTSDGIMVEEINMGQNYTPCESIYEKCDTAEITENDDEIKIDGNDFFVVINKKTAQMENVVYKNKLLVKGGPHLHIEGLELKKWLPDSVNAAVFENEAVVILKGSYEYGFDVEFILKIASCGYIKTEYNITTDINMTKDISLSEVGVFYDIANDCDSVTWKRNGFHCTYPDDHIGRNEGTALKIINLEDDPEIYGRKPSRPWKDSMKNTVIYLENEINNGTATEDFRTMRENIIYYDVNYNDAGIKIRAMSDEPTAVRVDTRFFNDENFINDRDERIKYIGSWKQNEGASAREGTETYSTMEGDYCEVAFTGTGIRLIGTKHVDTGKFEVFIDGESKGIIDLYSNLGFAMKYVEIFRIDGLSYKEHTIKIVTLSDTYIGENISSFVVDCFEIFTESDIQNRDYRLVLNSQWSYPSLGWGNYTGKPCCVSNGLKGSCTMQFGSI